MRNSGILIIGILLVFSSCKTSSVSSTSGRGYKEDLSVHRPDLTATDVEEVEADSIRNKSTVTANFTQHLGAELDSVNQIIIQQNKQQRYVDGFTIQIYTGMDRNKANEARQKAIEMDPLLDPQISYQQPNYKVKIGQYTDRLEAHKVFETIKKEFPLALLIPERIVVAYE